MVWRGIYGPPTMEGSSTNKSKRVCESSRSKLWSVNSNCGVDVTVIGKIYVGNLCFDTFDQQVQRFPPGFPVDFPMMILATASAPGAPPVDKSFGKDCSPGWWDIQNGPTTVAFTGEVEP